MILEELKQLEIESKDRGIPIIGSKKGRFLYKKVIELKPRRILELGTANGYSGIILGHLGAEITTIDVDAKIQKEAKQNYKRFCINANVINGDGVKIVTEMAKNSSELYDVIFLDFIKKGYLEVMEACIKLVRKNGLIIADNISFQGCQDYKEAVLKDKRLRTEIISIGDGLASSKKL
ncbi:MAG: hypothetical protein AABW92_05460 [Nanoarchaeota archaeon]